MLTIHVGLPAVSLGILEAAGVQVERARPDLAQLMAKITGEIQQKFSLESLAEAKSIRSVRAMFHEWGVDPSKYRPSSEALTRRVVQGRGLYEVSNVVDIGNLGSIETGWPYGLYDRGKLAPPVSLRRGSNGEMYEGIGKRMWHLSGRPILADANGPFGSPISDSTRTMVTDTTRDVLAVLYAPEGASDASIQSALAQLGERLARFAGARDVRAGISGRTLPRSGK